MEKPEGDILSADLVYSGGEVYAEFRECYHRVTLGPGKAPIELQEASNMLCRMLERTRA